MTRLYCDGPTLLRAVAAAVANLERHVADVDALNVFPVPDGDTGSNMLATMRAALEEAERLPGAERDLARVAEALGRGALRGARGNSGVILAQIIRGMSGGVDGHRRASGAHLAAGLRQGAETAYGAVLDPVEGTILTVIRDVADAAEAHAAHERHVESVLSAAIDAAARSVERTRFMLPVLSDAGVVDSGGVGLLRILEGTIRIDGAQPRTAAGPPWPAASHLREAALPHATPDSVYGYETVFLVESPDGSLDIDSLRRDLDAIGESVVVAGDRYAARVHVHGALPDQAIAAGLRAGRLSDIAITDLDADAADVREHGRDRPVQPVSRDRLAVPQALVAVVQADGGEELLRRLGVGRVVGEARGEPPSLEALDAAVRASGAQDVLVLAVADGVGDQLRGLAGMDEVRVHLVPIRNIAEAVAAALAFDPAAPVTANRERMALEAARLRTFTVTPAADRSSARAADVHGRVLAVGTDAPDATLRAIRALGGEGSELVTLYAVGTGDGLDVHAVREAVLATWPSVEVDEVAAGDGRGVLLVALD